MISVRNRSLSTYKTNMFTRMYFDQTLIWLLMGHPASPACLSTSTIPQSPVAILKPPTPSDRNWGSTLRLMGKLNLVQSQDVWTPHLSADNVTVSWAGDLWLGLLSQSNLWRVDKEQVRPMEGQGDLSMGFSVSPWSPWNQPCSHQNRAMDSILQRSNPLQMSPGSGVNTWWTHLH